MSMTFAPCSTKQKAFLESNAQITVFGGSMGCAKTYGGLLRHLRWIDDPNYVGYVIRKNEKVLRDGGGAFDEACAMYKAFDPRVKITLKPMVVTFPSGAKISFSGFADDKAKENYRGLQLSGVMVDEGTQLSESHVEMLISRLRTKAKMLANLWITCNPDPDSYLFKWIEWYLYPKGTVIDGVLVEGRPDPTKNGKLRYMIRVNGEYQFADTAEELKERFPKEHDAGVAPMTFRFIGATIYDNPPMLKNNPTYLSKLQGLPRVQKERDLYGNWLARAEQTGYFKREWAGDLLHTIPLDVVKRVRCYDIAGTLPSETTPDPDWTVGALMSRLRDGTIVVEDIQRFRKRHGEVTQEIIRIAKEDVAYYGDVQVYVPEDAGISGKFAAAHMIKELAYEGVAAKPLRVGTKSKLERFKPFAAMAEVGKVRVVRGDWNDEFFFELEAFDGTRKSIHDDQCDAVADGFRVLAQNKELPSFELGVFKRR